MVSYIVILGAFGRYDKVENRALGLARPLSVMMEWSDDGDRVCKFVSLACRNVFGGSRYIAVHFGALMCWP